MALANQVRLLGNLGSDPEVRNTPGGTAVCNFRMATNEKYKDSKGKVQERTEWHRIVVWASAAVNAGEYLKKGSKVLLEGALRTREWEDKKKDEDGNPIKRYTTEIHVGNGGIQFLDRAPGKTNQGARPDNKEMQDELENLTDDDQISAGIGGEDVPF